MRSRTKSKSLETLVLYASALAGAAWYLSAPGQASLAPLLRVGGSPLHFALLFGVLSLLLAGLLAASSGRIGVTTRAIFAIVFLFAVGGVCAGISNAIAPGGLERLSNTYNHLGLSSVLNGLFRFALLSGGWVFGLLSGLIVLAFSRRHRTGGAAVSRG